MGPVQRESASLSAAHIAKVASRLRHPVVVDRAAHAKYASRCAPQRAGTLSKVARISCSHIAPPQPSRWRLAQMVDRGEPASAAGAGVAAPPQATTEESATRTNGEAAWGLAWARRGAAVVPPNERRAQRARESGESVAATTRCEAATLRPQGTRSAVKVAT
jgi:hypothetical protein